MRSAGPNRITKRHLPPEWFFDHSFESRPINGGQLLFLCQLPRIAGAAPADRAVYTFFSPLSIDRDMEGYRNGFIVAMASGEESNPGAFDSLDTVKVKMALMRSDGNIYDSGAKNSGLPTEIYRGFKSSSGITWAAARINNQGTSSPRNRVLMRIPCDAGAFIFADDYWVQWKVECLYNSEPRAMLHGVSGRTADSLHIGQAAAPGMAYKALQTGGIDAASFYEDATGDWTSPGLTTTWNHATIGTFDAALTAGGQSEILYATAGLYR
jgi:hypothetical protein